MVDLNQLQDVAVLALIVATIVQFVKWVWTDNTPEVMPVVAVGVSIGIALLTGAVLGQLQSPADAWERVIGGFLAALMAVGGYESSLDKLKPFFKKE